MWASLKCVFYSEGQIFASGSSYNQKGDTDHFGSNILICGAILPVYQGT